LNFLSYNYLFSYVLPSLDYILTFKLVHSNLPRAQIPGFSRECINKYIIVINNFINIDFFT